MKNGKKSHEIKKKSTSKIESVSDMKMSPNSSKFKSAVNFFYSTQMERDPKT